MVQKDITNYHHYGVCYINITCYCCGDAQLYDKPVHNTVHLLQPNIVQVVRTSYSLHQPVVWDMHVLCEQWRWRHVGELSHGPCCQLALRCESHLRLQDVAVETVTQLSVLVIDWPLVVCPMMLQFFVFLTCLNYFGRGKVTR